MREGAFIGVGAGCLYLLLALSSYDAGDPGWSRTGEAAEARNAGGLAGAWVADAAFYLIGYMAWLLPPVLAWRAWVLFQRRFSNEDWDWLAFASRGLGLLLFLVGGAGLAEVSDIRSEKMPEGVGGILGQAVGAGFLGVFNLIGSRLILGAVFLAGAAIVSDLSWLRVLEWVGYWTLKLGGALARLGGALGSLAGRMIGAAAGAVIRFIGSMWRRSYQFLKERFEARRARRQRQEALREYAAREAKRAPPTITALQPSPPLGTRAERERQQPLFDGRGEGRGGTHAKRSTTGAAGGTASKERDADAPPRWDMSGLPPLDLLDERVRDPEHGYSQQTLQALSRLLELKLADFGISAEVAAVYPGPVITRFEVQPAAGVKASRIANLAKDLARSLAVVSVRVVEVIPGKSVVGIEIPNEDREIVNFREVLSSLAFDESKAPLSLALGHDISGQPVVADLAKMPHLLVAGTTGAGKSVALNAMLLSMLYKSSPADVRLILVDPKMLELSVYDGIPHLLTPVITDMKDAANGLRWCIGEMERRYQLMAALGVRNLAGYNRKLQDAERAGAPLKDPLWTAADAFGADGAGAGPGDAALDETGSGDAAAQPQPPALEALPSIVVVIDEFADMMMIVGKKVDQLIARLAQKARAAGIHLILATQRPSVDVITGLIKANIPTRIAFQVSSKVDSRTILDQGGAEQLLGHGDMLFLPPGTAIPVRVHGAFVDDNEVHRVVADWKGRGAPAYIDLVEAGSGQAFPLGGIGGGGRAPLGGGNALMDGDEDGEDAALYDEAVRHVTESRRASISSVQRKLRIGYNRAARLLEAMELAGVVSAMGSNGQREVIAPPPVEE